MTATDASYPPRSLTFQNSPSISVELRERTLDEIFQRWESGADPDALGALAEHPDLRESRSAILELACEEYWHRIARGESPHVSTFCDRFPGHSTALRRVLAVGSQLDTTAGVRFKKREWPAIRTVYRGFLLQELLGRGAFSRVYLALDTSLADRRVALKVTTMPGNEPLALGKLTHENIVPAYAYFPAEYDEYAALVMPYWGRATLEDVLDLLRTLPSRPTSAKFIYELIADDRSHSRMSVQSTGYIDAVIRIAHGLCLGLAKAHQLGFLHLDIKPSNVLLTTDGVPKLLDFNLTQFLNDGENLRLGGTLPYMSPEQLAATTSTGSVDTKVDCRSDLFSLGVMLYELLAGSHPFGELDPSLPIKTSSKLLGAFHRDGPVPLRRYNPSVNESFARLIESCLEYDPLKRPQSAEVFAASLRNQLGWKPTLRRASLRYPRSYKVAIVGATLISCGILYGWSQAPSYADRCYADAVAALRDDRLSDTEHFLTEALAREPTNIRARLLRAQGRVRSHQLDLAVSDYESLRHTDTPEAISGLIYCLALQKKFSQASDLESVVAGFRTQSAANLNNLAYCRMEVGDYESAREMLDRAVLLAPNEVSIRFNRALTDLRRSDVTPKYLPTVGVADLEFAVRLRESGDLYRILASLYLAIDDGSSARMRAEQALTKAMACGYARGEIKKSPRFEKLELPMEVAAAKSASLETPRFIQPF